MRCLRAPHAARPGGAATRIGLIVALAAATPAIVNSVDAPVEVGMYTSADGKRVYFEPSEVHVRIGQTVRWIRRRGYHSTTAYPPGSAGSAPSIPERSQPWDSDVLIADYPSAGSYFEYTFEIPGTYDYFCRPHERAGMVGRVVVEAGDTD